MGLSLHRSHVGEPGGGALYQWLQETDIEGIWKGDVSLHRGPIGGPWQESSFTGDLRERWDFVLSRDLVYLGLQEICKRRLRKRTDLTKGALLGNLEGGGSILLQTSRDRCRRTLEVKHLSPWELCVGNLEGGLHNWGLWSICEGRLWKLASLSKGAPLGKLGGGVFIYCERQ